MSNSISFPPFRLDLDEDRVWRGRKQLTIRRKPLAVLRYLIGHPRKLVTQEELLNAVWGGSVVSDSAVRSHLHELRQVLGEGVIETVIGRGYRFMAALEGTTPERPITVQRLVVGRAAEMEALRAALGRAHAGHRQICFVTGEPGMGKTTLVDAFLDELDRPDVSAARGQCVEQHGAPEAYLPMLQIAVALRASTRGEDALNVLLRRAPTFLAQLPNLVPGPQLADVMARAVGGSDARMVRELIDAFEDLASNHTLVLVLEDLQWSDVATLDLLSALAQRRERARLLVIGTSRRAEAQTATHPLNRMMRPLVTRGAATSIAIEPITASNIDDLLALRFPGHAFPPALSALVDGITEGTPLFVTSVLDDLLGRGMVAERDGRWQLTAGSEEVAAHRPDSIRQMIDMRLDRLTLDEQRLLEAASLVGIDVSIGVVAAALELPLETVDENADGLARRALFLRREPVEEWPDGALHTRYAFTHGLVREVCRDRSAPARRERWHRNIASHLEASGRGDVALRLASHFEDGHLPERALRCYIQAAAQAMSRFASEDAMHLCVRAERLLPRIADARTRDALELDLLDSQSLIAMRRFQDLTRDPAELLQRRIVLARRFSDPSRVCLALLDLALLHSIRAQHDAVVALLSEVDTLLLDTTVAPAIHLYVDSTRAMSMFWQGRVRDSQALFSRVFSTPIPEDAPSLLMQDLLDRRSMMLGYLSGICWMTGEPDRAIREVQEAFDLATSNKDAYAIGLAGTMLTWLQFARRDPPDLLRATAERLLARPDCAPWHEPCAILVAWVKSRTAPLSDPEADAVMAGFRSQISVNQLGLSLLAARVLGALKGSSRLADARALVDEVIGSPATHRERPFIPDLLRQLGDIASDPTAAAAYYLDSLTTARDNGAVSYELRAANELARLWLGTPREREARGHLESALARCVDGAETLDQREARAFLARS